MKNKWIKTKDRLPKYWQLVLVYKLTYGITVGYLIERKDLNYPFWSVEGVSGGGKTLILQRNPTDWMPLPKPPVTL